MNNLMTECISQFQCSACGKVFRWRTELAGRKVRCTCSQLIHVAAQPPEPTPVLSPSSAAGEQGLTGNLWAAAFSPAASPVARALDERHDDKQLSHMHDLIYPGLLIALGIVVNIVGWQMYRMYFPQLSTGEAVAGAISLPLVQLLIYLPLAVATGYFTARLLNCDFGMLKLTVLKLAGALCSIGILIDMTFCGAIMLLGFEDYLVLVLGFGLYLVFFSAIIWSLFLTDLQESLIFSLGLTLPRFAFVFIALPWVHHHWFAS